ncbi:hypothetical protein [Sphingomonas sp. NBWT7]|uniref:hypothetical protein n=1 Tax=Sphingomonas sp. NBWT7 TaxID=2596913 RepID=UPI001CA598BD|nr:hypothetical protein [Sphingomonas sp. NBWT7]
MSDHRYALVVTTINPPNKALTMLATGAASLDARFWIIGDTKSPADFSLPNADFLDVAAQQDTGFRTRKPVRRVITRERTSATSLPCATAPT